MKTPPPPIWGEPVEEDDFDPNEEFYNHDKALSQMKEKQGVKSVQSTKSKGEGKLKLRKRVVYTYEYGNSSDEENDKNAAVLENLKLGDTEKDVRKNSPKMVVKSRDLQKNNSSIEVIDLTHLNGEQTIQGSVVPSRSKRIQLKAINAMKTELRKSERDEEILENNLPQLGQGRSSQMLPSSYKRDGSNLNNGIDTPDYVAQKASYEIPLKNSSRFGKPPVDSASASRRLVISTRRTIDQLRPEGSARHVIPFEKLQVS